MFSIKNMLGVAIMMAATATMAQTQTTVQKVTPNCKDVKIAINSVMDNKFNFTAYWNDEGTFPNPPTYTEIGDSRFSKIGKFSFECPELSVHYDGNVATIKGNDINDLIQRLSSRMDEMKINFYFYGFYKYPNIKKDFISLDYGFDLKNFAVFSGIKKYSAGDDLSRDSIFIDIDKTAVIAYKADNGELKPLLYNMKMSDDYLNDLNSANTFDIYNKFGGDKFNVLRNHISRIHVDKPNATIKLYRNAPFPQK